MAFSQYGLAPPASAADEGIDSVALSEIDRNLLERCLQQKTKAWENFVDRFMGLIVHVVNHTAQARSVRLSAADVDDLCAEVFLNIVKDDFAILRRFRGQSSLATYLTVVARRIAVKQITHRKTTARLSGSETQQAAEDHPDPRSHPEQRLGNLEEVHRLLEGLQATEAQVVRMYHLQGKSYREISLAIGISENSIGPILSRARNKMRRAGIRPAAG